MESEIPAMLHARESDEPERFTFHSSRMRMTEVTKEQLEAMDDDSLRCAVELADARVDVMGYACLVAIMSRGHGYHETSQHRLEAQAAGAGCPHASGHQRGSTRESVARTGSQEDGDHRALHGAADKVGG